MIQIVAPSGKLPPILLRKEKGLIKAVILPRKSILQINKNIIEIARKKDIAQKKFPEQEFTGERYEGSLTYLESKLLDMTLPENPIKRAVKISMLTMFEILCHHSFTNGNKRTALIASLLILGFNIAFCVNRESKQKYIVSLDKNELDRAKTLELIADWIEGETTEKHYRKLHKLLEKNGIKIKYGNPIREHHIKEFLNNFLRKRIKKMSKKDYNEIMKGK